MTRGGFSSVKTDSGNFFNGKLVGTKYGITGRTLAAHRNWKDISLADVKSLSLAEAEEIYRKSYWSQSGGTSPFTNNVFGSRRGSVIDALGPGSPEGVVSAAIGSVWSRTDGGAGTSRYVKESGTGNTGWVAK